MIHAPTGIPKLNELLGGGLSPGELIAFWSSPGLDSSVFAHMIADAAVKRGENVAYFTQSKKDSTVLREMERYGFELKGKLIFIDGYSGLVNRPSDAAYLVKRARNVGDITAALKRALERKPTIVVFDSLSSIIDVCGKDTLDEVEVWRNMLKEVGAAGIFMFTEWPYESDTLEKIKDMLDTIVRLSALEESVVNQRFFTVIKQDGKWVDRTGVPFEVGPDGLRVEIPKIVVTGPEGSGKSSFVASASTNAISAGRAGTTVGIDYGRVDYQGFNVSLFGTPSHKRFDAILPVVGRNAKGVIVLVDATQPETFPHANIFLEKTGLTNAPKIVVSNHTGLPGALSVGEIRKKMNLPDKVPLIALTEREKEEGRPAAMDKKEVHKVLDALFNQVI